MAKQIDDKTILLIMREEWTSKKSDLVTEVSLYAESDKKEGDVPFETVSIGLKIKHKETGILYTISIVSPGTVTLRSPEGALSVVTNASLEEEFELA